MVNRVLLLGFALLLVLSTRAQQFASELEMSTEDVVYYYRICNASFGMQDYVMTDCSNEDNVIPVQLLQTEMTDERSHWKLTSVGKDKKVMLTNRSTGLQLGGMSLNIGNHNSTRLTVNGSPGFIVTPLGDETFSLQCIEDDGVERSLALAERESSALIWPEKSLSTSIIGWKFMLVDTIDTSINNADTRVSIHLEGKCVYVSGCSKWQLYNTQGEKMHRTAMLPAGVYIVKTPNEVVKVMIR